MASSWRFELGPRRMEGGSLKSKIKVSSKLGPGEDSVSGL